MGCLPSDISDIERGGKRASEDYISRSSSWLKLTDAETQELQHLANARLEPIDRGPSQLTFDFAQGRYKQLQQYRKVLIKAAAGSRSKQELRAIAAYSLDCLDLRTPFPDLLDLIENKLPLVDPEYYLHVYATSGDEVPAYSEANGDVAKRMVLSDHAYQGLRKGEPELRFLAAHELAHWLLHAETLNYSHKLQPAEVEANQLAVEFLLPRHVVKKFRTAGQLAMTRRVPLKIARARMQDLKLGPFGRKKVCSGKATANPGERQDLNKIAYAQNTRPSATCFISYSWEVEDHNKWILRLAEALQKNGVYVRLDQWDIGPGTVLTQYIEKSIRESKYVLLVCTPIFAERANTGTGGVGYEKTIVSAEIFDATSHNLHNCTKFIPVLRNGRPDEAIPSYLKSRTYVDMRDDNSFESGLEELLRHIYSTPAVLRPPLGTKPQFAARNLSQNPNI
jgi:hypothetical protein